MTFSILFSLLQWVFFIFWENSLNTGLMANVVILYARTFFSFWTVVCRKFYNIRKWMESLFVSIYWNWSLCWICNAYCTLLTDNKYNAFFQRRGGRSRGSGLDERKWSGFKFQFESLLVLDDAGNEFIIKVWNFWWMILRTENTYRYWRLLRSTFAMSKHLIQFIGFGLFWLL